MAPSDAAAGIASALVRAGLVQQGSAERAAEIVAARLPRPVAYNFKADSEFLHASLEHHVQVYFSQVMEPMARVHHNRATPGGRLMKDDETEEAAISLTESVVNELGDGYIEHLSRYFGESGLAAYVFSRIRTRLLEEAARYNEDYLAALSKRMKTRRAADTASQLAQR